VNVSSHPGRVWVLGICGVCLVISLVGTFVTNVASGVPLQITDIIRFVLTILLFVALYQGRNWARWVTAVLLGLGGFISVGGGLVLLQATSIAVLLILIGVVYLGCVCILFMVPSVRHFFATAGASRA
jgi:hypothetical protein